MNPDGEHVSFSPKFFSDLGKATNVGKTIINHPPVITISYGGINLPFPVSRVGSAMGRQGNAGSCPRGTTRSPSSTR